MFICMRLLDELAFFIVFGTGTGIRVVNYGGMLFVSTAVLGRFIFVNISIMLLEDNFSPVSFLFLTSGFFSDLLIFIELFS